MPLYRFRLSAVQRVRESLRDDARQRLADALLAEEKLAAEAERLKQEIAEVRRQRADEAAADRPDTDRLIAGQRHEVVLNAQLHDLAKKQQLVEQEITRRRETLAVADRQVRVLEVLDEQGRQRHRQQELAAEQKMLDELAVSAWNRRTTSPQESN